MRVLLRRPRELREIGACRSGLALTEFAFALPILLALGLYGFETANLAIAHLRVSNIAMMTADNAARVRDSIDEANVVELLAGGKMTGTSLDFPANGRIILSSFEQTPDGTKQWIRWQRCDGALQIQSSYGKPKTVSGAEIVNGTEVYHTDRQTASTAAQRSDPTHASLTAVGPAGRQIAAGSGTAVMVVEVEYEYQPIVSERLFGPKRIRYEGAFNVRQRTNQSLLNAGRTTPKSCDTFSA